MEDEEIQQQLEEIARAEQARIEAEERAAEEAIRAKQAAQSQQQQKPAQQPETPAADPSVIMSSIRQVNSAVEQILAPVIEKSDGSENAKKVIEEMRNLIEAQVAPVIAGGATVDQLLKEDEFVKKARAMGLGSLMSQNAIKQPKSLEVEHTGTSTGSDASPAGQLVSRLVERGFTERRVTTAIRELKAAYPNLKIEEGELHRYLQATPGAKR
jgi:hypothetical protein